MVMPSVYVLIVFVEVPKDHYANNLLRIIIVLFLLFSFIDYCLLFCSVTNATVLLMAPKLAMTTQRTGANFNIIMLIG